MSASPKHITEQAWVPELREDGVYLVGADDRTAVVKLCRPDHGSDLLVAGYIAGLQGQGRAAIEAITRGPPPSSKEEETS